MVYLFCFLLLPAYTLFFYPPLLQYKVKKRDLIQRTLWVTVWNWDRLGANSFLGEICISLGGANLRRTSERWYELHDFTETGVVMATPVGHTPLPPDHSSSLTRKQHAPRTPLLKQSTMDEEERSKSGTPIQITQKKESNEDPEAKQIPIVTVEDFDIK